MEGRARAAAGRQKAKRFLTFFFANGVNAGNWTGTGGDTSLTLPAILTPMETLKSKFVLLNGVGMATARDNPGNAHVVGMTNILTARKFIDAGRTFGWGSGITLDVEIGKQLPVPGGFESLQFGVQSNKSYATSAEAYLSYSGPNAAVPAQDDPAVMFDRVFGGTWKPPVAAGAAAPVGLDPSVKAGLIRRKNILDLVKQDYSSLITKLGAEDKMRVQKHLAEVEAIQARISFDGAGAGTGTPANCQKPAEPTNYGSISDKTQFVNNLNAQQKMLVAALACQRTRSATFQLSLAQSATFHTWVGVNEQHHLLSHKTDGGAQGLLQKIQTWYMARLFDLCKALDSVPDDDGTLLDNTLILVCSEVGVGHTHSYSNMPFALAGGAGGALKGGRLLKYDNATHNDLYTSILNLMGIPATNFGDTKYCKGPLAGIV